MINLDGVLPFSETILPALVDGGIALFPVFSNAVEVAVGVDGPIAILP
ncbi:hypothetical protein [Argonema galeatum]|nr:hypothetical protein [Argonema galeatum]MCL1464571.1 hypothetical protein [Argonema galeatum A003/A1]